MWPDICPFCSHTYDTLFVKENTPWILSDGQPYSYIFGFHYWEVSGLCLKDSATDLTGYPVHPQLEYEYPELLITFLRLLRLKAGSGQQTACWTIPSSKWACRRWVLSSYSWTCLNVPTYSPVLVDWSSGSPLGLWRWCPWSTWHPQYMFFCVASSFKAVFRSRWSRNYRLIHIFCSLKDAS